MFAVSKTLLESIGTETQEFDVSYSGLMTKGTNLNFSIKKGTKLLKLQRSENTIISIVNPEFTFESMGIGGLDKQLSDIFRRAFATRKFPPVLLKKYGIKHVKGVLLYGPPGTGKTLIARELSKAL